MSYLLVKWLHILSSTLLFGTGLGSAFYFFFASLGREPRVVAAVAGYVVLADWLFTAPTIVLQPASGFYLLHLAGLEPFAQSWVRWSFALYALAVLAWLPVVWLQLRMRDLARAAAAAAAPLPERYWRLLAVWTLLGVVAFFSLVAVYYLMIAKPA